jgi:diguanylate cyclase (GGDEF)-like protein
MWKAIVRDGSWQGEIWNRRKSGEIYPEWLTITSVKNLEGLTTHFVAIHTDISARKAAEDEIRNLAYFDPLTRLPNRRMLLDCLHQAQVGCARLERLGALIFIDLDNFKTLNDTQGHDQGDLLLQQVAQRLRECVREGDTVSRLGGDEFVVLVENLSKDIDEAARQAEIVSEKILGEFKRSYLSDGREFHCTASIGLTLFGDKPEAMETLMMQADFAMYQAKAGGRNAYRFFDPVMQAAVTAHNLLEKELREAVRETEFVLYYQAQVDGQGRLAGAEALVRWQHRQRGIVEPDDFIPVAEGLIRSLGHAVLGAAWAQRPDLTHLTVAVNISAREFAQANFADQVLAILAATGANPWRLKLELTESMLVADVGDVIAKMGALKGAGVGFALDDFGTGYSSLAYLNQLPLDQLKIDRSFVMNIESDASAALICAATINLAHSLNLQVVAEGVETAAQRHALSEVHQCDLMQGYLFSRPLPVHEFERFAEQCGASVLAA